MVYIRETPFDEDIKEVYEDIDDNNNRCVVIKVENSNIFEYWFPIMDGESYHDSYKILSPIHMTVIEIDPENDDRTEYPGTSDVTVPKSVAEKAEEFVGLQIPP